MVQVVESLKGEAPKKPFLVGGFNQRNRPPERLEAEVFRAGEQYLLFLRPSNRVHVGTEIPDSVRAHLHQLVADGLISKDDLPAQRRYYERPIYEPGYRVPSPTTGDFMVQGEHVQGDWYAPSNPRTAAWVSSKTAFALIRGLVDGPREARGLLARQLSKDLVSAIKLPAESPEMRNRVALFRWLMCAQGAYGELEMQSLIEHVMDQDALMMRLLAARALRSLPESRATLALISPLLNASESAVQAEAARSLVHGDFSALAGALLLEALANSALESGRAAMIRGITHFKLQEAAERDLLDCMRAEKLNAGILAALRAHFATFPSAEARDRFVREAARSSAESAGLFIDLLFEDGRPAAQAVLRSKMMTPAISADVRVQWLRRFYGRYVVDDPIFGQTLEVLMKQRKSQAASEQVLALRMIRISSGGDGPEAAHLRAHRIAEFTLTDAVELMLHYRPKHALTKPALLYLLKHHAADPHAMACALLLPNADVLEALRNPPNTEGAESRVLVEKALRVLAARQAPADKRIRAWLLLLERSRNPGMRAVFWAGLSRSVGPANSATELGPALRSLLTLGTPDAVQALNLLQAAGIPLAPKEAERLAGGEPGLRHWPSIFRQKRTD
jgi:hypothetical protein